MSYQAIVAVIKTRPHPKADRLLLGDVSGHQVVVGLDTEDGEVGLFFPCDGQLSEAFCKANDLVSYTDAQTGKKAGGYFAKNRRVRAQKFRGERSDGYWCHLGMLEGVVDAAYTAELKEGDTFTALGGVEICHKYVTPATQRAMSGNQRQRKVVKKVVFPEHKDTAQWRYARNLPTQAVYYISEKVHGTSGRYGHVLETRNLIGWRKWRAYLAGQGQTVSEWKHLHGSRRVVLDDENPGYYGTNDFRRAVVGDLRLHKGEVLYYEIVGDVAVGSPIMPPQDIKDDLKELRKRYGPKMAYTYGCLPGTQRMLVYRITQINEDGHEVDLPWLRVVGRCSELGLEPVATLAGPITQATGDTDIFDLVKGFIEGDSSYDSRHITEGVVVRVESSEGVRFYKEKSWAFKYLEGIVKDADAYVDIEEAS